MTWITARVRRVMNEVGSSGPRAGWVAGWVFGLADAYGTRDDRALEVVAAAAEAWSSVLYGADPLPFLQRLLEQDRPVLRQRLRSWIERAERPHFPDVPLPEAVFTLLVATEATIELAAVEDPAAVRRLAVATGLRLERGAGDDAWAWISEEPRTWEQVAADLPPSAFIEALDDVEAHPGRRWTQWRPFFFEETGPFGDDSMARGASWLSGGKGLRGSLCQALCERTGRKVSPEIVDWVHAASLAVDDIMDDAPVRRGRASLHVRTDEPFAISVASRIVAEVLAAEAPEEREILVVAIEAMVRGQISEWARVGHQVTVEQVESDMARKTGSLFAAAAELAGEPSMRPGLREFGMELGTAFQVVDDLLDATGDPETMGKATGTDRRGGRTTLVDLLGEEGARIRAEQGLERALRALRRTIGSAPEIEALARACVERAR